MKLLRSFIITLSVLIFPLTFVQRAYAQAVTSCPDGQVPSDFGCIPQDPVGFVGKFYGIGLGILGFIAVIFMIIGGYYMMTSQGDPERLRTAKSYIIYSIAGVLLAVFGFVIVQFITGSFLKIPGFS